MVSVGACRASDCRDITEISSAIQHVEDPVDHDDTGVEKLGPFPRSGPGRLNWRDKDRVPRVALERAYCPRGQSYLRTRRACLPSAARGMLACPGVEAVDGYEGANHHCDRRDDRTYIKCSWS